MRMFDMRERGRAERLRAIRVRQARARGALRPRVGEGIAEVAVIDDRRAQALGARRGERLPRVIACFWLVDDRDVGCADEFARFEPAVLRQDRRTEPVGFRCVAERFVRESFGEGVVDDERERARRMRRGVGEDGGQAGGGRGALQERRDRRRIVEEPRVRARHRGAHRVARVTR